VLSANSQLQQWDCLCTLGVKCPGSQGGAHVVELGMAGQLADPWDWSNLAMKKLPGPWQGMHLHVQVVWRE